MKDKKAIFEDTFATCGASLKKYTTNYILRYTTTCI